MLDVQELQNKCAWVSSPGPNAQIEFRHVPVCQPRTGAILVKMEASGVCHSDCHSIYGNTPMSTHVAGHEGIGRVVAVGKDVNDTWLDRRVGVSWLHRACKQCDTCHIDRAHCPKQDNTGRNVAGTFQDYCEADADFVTPIPNSLDPCVAAPLLCGGLTMYGAFRRAQVRTGDFVVILGAGGGLGHLGVQIGRVLGLRVIAVDSGQEKRASCQELGAEYFIDYTSALSVQDEVLKITKSGAHFVVAAAGSPSTYDCAIGMLRNCGTLVCIGIPPSEYRLKLDVFEAIVRGIRIIGSSIGSKEDMSVLLDLAASGQVVPTVHRFDFESLEVVLGSLKSGQITGRAVVTF